MYDSISSLQVQLQLKATKDINYELTSALQLKSEVLQKLNGK